MKLSDVEKFKASMLKDVNPDLVFFEAAHDQVWLSVYDKYKSLHPDKGLRWVDHPDIMDEGEYNAETGEYQRLLVHTPSRFFWDEELESWASYC